MTGENRAHTNEDLVATVQSLWQERFLSLLSMLGERAALHLQDVSTRRGVQLEWIKGHTGDIGNATRQDLPILAT